MDSFDNGHALVIGVGGDLPCTVRDATGLAEILKDPGRCAYPEEQVTVLTESSADRDSVFDALDTLSACPEDSTVIVFFSGHGYQIETGIGKAHFLLPFGYDTSDLLNTAIGGEHFMKKLLAIPSQKTLLLLDCCHAGGIEDAKAPGIKFAKAPLPQGAEEFLASGSGRVAIASSQADELSYTGKPYSAFTLAIIEALSGARVAKKDGFVRVADLAMHAGAKVPERTNEKQHPILNFDAANNFPVAYYAGGGSEPKAPPFKVEPVIDLCPEAPAPSVRRDVSIGDAATGNVIITGDSNRVQTNVENVRRKS